MTEILLKQKNLLRKLTHFSETDEINRVKLQTNDQSYLSGSDDSGNFKNLFSWIKIYIKHTCIFFKMYKSLIYKLII